MMRYVSTLLLLLPAFLLFSQKPHFQGYPVKNLSEPALDEQFSKWDVYQFDVQGFDAYVKNAGTSVEFSLQFGSLSGNIDLAPRDLRAPNYTLSVLTDEGVIQQPPLENVTFSGRLAGKNGGSVSLTIRHDFLYGFVEKKGELYFIEPLWYFLPDAPKDRFVVYAASAVKPKPGAICGFDEMKHHTPQEKEPVGPGSYAKMGCKLVQLAIASDLSMYNKYGSVAAVQLHNVGVMNNVQTNYDNEFNDELQFSIVEQFVVTPPANDPWSSSTNAGTLLDSFTAWGPTGFTQIHDLGQLWTNRNFQGGTIGIAWLGAVCTSSRYHCLQDFTTNANLLRVLTSHEIGHNFNASHDASGSPTIMAPAVNNTNTWSTQSLNSINAYYPNRPCLSNCTAASLPPVANFTASPTTGCAPLSVTYTDQSQNTPTAWNWTFPGGSPATSTQQNPTVTYFAQGTYSATLTVTNAAGTNTLTKTNIVSVASPPVASFNYTPNGMTISFVNLSIPNTGLSYFWDFGNGQSSIDPNPTHTFAFQGYYNVTLYVSNACGNSTSSLLVPVFTQPTAGFTASPTTGCAGMSVAFTDQSSPNSVNWAWSFPGGTPSTSGAPNPVVTYSTPGVYSVTLTVSNPAGSNTLTKTNFITVNAGPSPAFTYSVNGGTVVFTNTSTNATGYSWNFGDGSTSSTQTNPTHTYNSNGNFTVTLTATNSCGPATASQVVTIIVPPVAGFSASATSGCEPLSVSFFNNSPNATSYAWSFPGGTPSSSTASNPTVVYASAGTYNVTLVVNNSAGADTLTLSNYVSVSPQPAPGFSSSVNGLTATFTNTSTNASSYSWNFGDGQTSTQVNPSHTYSADGTYTVTLSATNACGTVTTTQTVTIITPPTASFAVNITTGCAPLTVQFSDQSTTNATAWNWQFPGGTPNTSTVQNPVVMYPAPGIYTVTLTVSNAAGQNTSTQTNYVNVTTTPVAAFNFTTNFATATFSNTSTNASSYTWNFGDGATSTQANPSHTYANDGTYMVTLSATNACGTVTTTQTVTIVTPPSAGFAANVTSGCAPLTVQFSNQSSDNATSFAWQFPGGTPATSTAQNPVVTYSTSGNYTVTLTVSNSAGSNTTTQTNYIAVTTVPASGFTANTNVFTANFTNTTSNATTYTWNFGDGSTSTAVNPSHTYANDGTYSVTLTAGNACGTSTFTQNVVVSSLPQAGFSASATTGCAPFTVQFTDQSSPNTTAWNWSFPGGSPSTSTQKNPVVIYNTPGTYSVTLTAINALGENTVVQTGYITLISSPAASFTFSTDLLTAVFQNTSTGATSYLWNFGDGETSNLAHPSHIYSEDGVYTVTLTATNICGSVTSTQTITVVSMPTAGFSANATSGCAPFTVQFTNESSENATSFAWQFPGGTPATSTAANPSVTYSSAGTYPVTLTVSNAAGQNVLTQPNLIVVGSVPVVGFTGSLDETTIHFTNTTANATSYVWNFGDGQTSTEASPTHTYAGDGVYNVTLTATNGCGSISTMTTFTVVTPPAAGFGAAQTSGCAPFTVSFFNESSENAASFSWSFPGGLPATSNEENPVVTYNTAGVFTVTLTVSNAAGSDTYSLTDYVTVAAGPDAGFAFSVDGQSVDFTNTSSNAMSYTWDFGDGETSTSTDAQHTYQADGIYQVTLTATNDCGSVTTTKTIVIATAGPIALFSAQNTAGCAPLTVKFENLSSSNATFFEWSFPGGNPAASTEANPTVVYSVPGTYDVTLKAGNDLGENMYSQTGFVVVNGAPATNFSYTVNSNTVTFTNLSTNATAYQWLFGDGTSSTAISPVHTFPSSGKYSVILTAENECGFSSASIVIQIPIFTAVSDLPGIHLFEVLPNPNDGHFTMQLAGEPQTSLEISFTNLLGQRLLYEKADFRSGQLTRDFSFGWLPAGLYVVQVKSGEKALMRKVVIE